jgi:hypothetical protein
MERVQKLIGRFIDMALKNFCPFPSPCLGMRFWKLQLHETWQALACRTWFPTLGWEPAQKSSVYDGKEIVKGGKLKSPNGTDSKVVALIASAPIAIDEKLDPRAVAIGLGRTPIVVSSKTTHSDPIHKQFI